MFISNLKGRFALGSSFHLISAMKRDAFFSRSTYWIPQVEVTHPFFGPSPGEECQGSDGVLSAAEREEICQEPTQSHGRMEDTKNPWGHKVLLVDDETWGILVPFICTYICYYIYIYILDYIYNIYILYHIYTFIYCIYSILCILHYIYTYYICNIILYIIHYIHII